MMQEKDDEEREDEFRNRVTNMPDASHATPSTLYSKRKLHPREAVSGNPLKYEPTNLACDIAAVLLAAQKKGVGNFVLLAYDMGRKGVDISFLEGASMFAVNKTFMGKIRADLFPIISDGFERRLHGFVTETGEPDFMRALVHVLIVHGLDGPATGYGCCRLVPALGTALSYDPPLYSSHHFENRIPCRNTRTDVGRWKSKSTLSGCLGGAEAAGKKTPQLCSLNAEGVPKLYAYIFPQYSQIAASFNYRTYVDLKKHIVVGCNGDNHGVHTRVDGDLLMLYGLQIPSLSSIEYPHCKTFTQKCRRRNLMVQCQGRVFTHDPSKAWSCPSNRFSVVSMSWC